MQDNKKKKESFCIFYKSILRNANGDMQKEINLFRRRKIFAYDFSLLMSKRQKLL